LRTCEIGARSDLAANSGTACSAGSPAASWGALLGRTCCPAGPRMTPSRET